LKNSEIEKKTKFPQPVRSLVNFYTLLIYKLVKSVCVEKSFYALALLNFPIFPCPCEAKKDPKGKTILIS
jgi:hypothetical protein